MTIKAIKEMYDGKYSNGDGNGKCKTSFVVFDYYDGNGKVVIVTTKNANRYIGRYVWQAVRVSDGKELIPAGSCRPCDSLDDAIDVAGEMMYE